MWAALGRGTPIKPRRVNYRNIVRAMNIFVLPKLKSTIIFQEEQVPTIILEVGRIYDNYINERRHLQCHFRENVHRVFKNIISKLKCCSTKFNSFQFIYYVLT